MPYAKIAGGFEMVRQRAEQYRQRAAQLNNLAEAERYGRLRDQLIEMALRYREMAENLLAVAGD